MKTDQDRKTHREENVQVTPDKAKQWLERNLCNPRRLNPRRIPGLAAEMQRGEWITYHPDPIAFDMEGNLKNGQHRLNAVVVSGVTLNMRVWFNCSEELIRSLDKGEKRRSHERIKLIAHDRYNRIAWSLVNRIFGTVKGTFSKDIRPTDEQADETYKSWANEIDYVVPRAYGASMKRIAVLLALIEYLRREPEKARAFCETLFMVDGPIQQARVLRDFIRDPKTTKLNSTAGDTATYGRSVYCCRCHIIGREVRALNRCATWDNPKSLEGE